MLFEIKHRWNGALLFRLDTTSFLLAVEAAIQSNANLTGANLRGADLRGANLTEANLRGADLRGANLRGADLTEAHLTEATLTGAHLRGANLIGADLTGADLTGANLRGANLRGANLRGAYLTGANLTGADLIGADLTIIRDDVWAVLSSVPSEVRGLRQALSEGRIDGSTYQGKCACLVGTIANLKGVEYTNIPLLTPQSSRPAERFFLSIRKGDTPANSQHASIAAVWIDTWLDNVTAAFGSNQPLR